MAIERIPLFPLEVVLFPGTPLPLHIFEPRYKTMVRNCIQNSQEFGVVLVATDKIAAVGCTAEIVEVAREYPDGRMDVVTMGSKPFRVVEVLSEPGYHEANIEYLEDEILQSEMENPALLKAYEECHLLLYGGAPEPVDGAQPVLLSYRIAADLPIRLERKQSLLELRDERKRQAQLIADIKELLPLLHQKNLLRERARSNGH